MRMIKLLCVVFCGISAFGVIRNAVIFRSALANRSPTMSSIFGMCASFAVAVLWSGALYGIQKKARIVWKMGWGVIIGSYLIFVARASASLLAVQQLPDRWIQLLFVLVASSAITAYWCYLWSKQKRYFIQPSGSSETSTN